MRLSTLVLCFAAVLCSPFASTAAELPKAPKPVKRVLPEYPPAADAAQINGLVTLALTIDDDGEVDDVDVLKETPPGQHFAEAAVKAVEQWRFAKGAPGRFQVTLQFEYVPPDLTEDEAGLPGAPPPTRRRGTLRYPRQALSAGMAGDVDIVVTIDPAGRVAEARVREEMPPGYGFADAALAYVRQWEFPPGGPGIYTITIRFRMEGGKPERPNAVAMNLSELIPAPPPISRVEPKYPEAAKAKGISGDVVIAVQINSRGRVTHGGVLSETPAGMKFGDAAFAAVIQWRFDTPEGAYRVDVHFEPD